SGGTGVGINLSTVSWVEVRGFTVTQTPDYGISASNSSHITISGSHVSFAGQPVSGENRTGIRINNTSDSLVSGNTSDHNSDYGIDDLTTTGQRIISNTAYHNVTAGINVEGGSTGATVENNISVDNGIKSPRTHSDIRIEHGSTAGTTVDYNLVYLTVPD